MTMAVSAFTNPLGCLLGNFFSGELFGTVANRLSGVFPVRSMPCRLASKGMGNLMQDNLFGLINAVVLDDVFRE
jgi:hypothetical protein